MNQWLIMLTFLVLMSVLITPASAQPIILDENQLKEYWLNDSDLIVKGTVVGNTSQQWTTEDGKPPENRYNNPKLYYDFIIEVDEVYKGELSNDAENKVYVRYLVATSDQVELETGQKVILYLKNNENTDTSEFGPKSYVALGRKIITDEEIEKDAGDIKSRSIFEQIFSFFSNFGKFFT